MIQAGLEWLAHALVGRSVSASTLDPRTSHVVPALAQIGLDEAEKVGAQPRRGFGRRGNRAYRFPYKGIVGVNRHAEHRGGCTRPCIWRTHLARSEERDRAGVPPVGAASTRLERAERLTNAREGAKAEVSRVSGLRTLGRIDR
jgi:hypothetical protein